MSGEPKMLTWVWAFTKPTYGRVVSKKVEYDGSELIRLRESYGISEVLFAELANWGKSEQSRLERPGRHVVQLRTFLRITYVLGVLHGIKYRLLKETKGKLV